MNTLKNLGIIFLGNLLAGLAYVSGVSFYYAIDGGYDALSLIGFLFFLAALLPLLVSTVIFPFLFVSWDVKSTNEIFRLGIFAFVSHLFSLIAVYLVSNLIVIIGMVTIFFIWLTIYISLCICLKLLIKKRPNLLVFTLKSGAIIAVTVIIVIGTIIYLAGYISKKNEISEVSLPVVSCNNNSDCSTFDCTNKGHRYYCDSTGFPRCGSDKVCYCSFGCL
jgi:hypothetical protein